MPPSTPVLRAPGGSGASWGREDGVVPPVPGAEVFSLPGWLQKCSRTLGYRCRGDISG